MGPEDPTIEPQPGDPVIPGSTPGESSEAKIPANEQEYLDSVEGALVNLIKTGQNKKYMEISNGVKAYLLEKGFAMDVILNCRLYHKLIGSTFSQEREPNATFDLSENPVQKFIKNHLGLDPLNDISETDGRS